MFGKKEKEKENVEFWQTNKNMLNLNNNKLIGKLEMIGH